MSASRAETLASGRDRSAEPWGLGSWILITLAVVTGVLLRLHQLSGQIIADDEWHALHTLPSNGYGYILTHLAACDYCIPLTAYDKLLSNTIGLSELGMRAPTLIAGVAALIVLPLLARAYLGAKASVTLACLLSISPLHIHYSRSARPYSIVLLLAIVGVIACDRWLSTGRSRWAGIYAGCAVLVPWYKQD